MVLRVIPALRLCGRRHLFIAIDVLLAAALALSLASFYAADKEARSLCVGATGTMDALNVPWGGR